MENKTNKLIATNDELIKLFIDDLNYLIFENGTVWSRNNIGYKNFKQLNPGPDSRGYININYRNKKLALHRIIYACFCGQLDSNLVINHIDGNPLNNNSFNLELIPQSKNIEHMYRVLNRPVNTCQRKLDEIQIIELRGLRENGWTNAQLREKFGLSKAAVSYIVNYKTYKNFRKTS